MSKEHVAKKSAEITWRVWLMAQSPGNTALLMGRDVIAAKVALSRLRKAGGKLNCTTRTEGDRTRFIFY